MTKSTLFMVGAIFIVGLIVAPRLVLQTLALTVLLVTAIVERGFWLLGTGIQRIYLWVSTPEPPETESEPEPAPQPARPSPRSGVASRSTDPIRIRSGPLR